MINLSHLMLADLIGIHKSKINPCLYIRIHAQVIPQRPRDLSCRAEGSRSLEAFENFADEGDPTLQCIVTRC